MTWRIRAVMLIASAPLALGACDPVLVPSGATQVVYCTRAPAGYVVPQDKWDPYMVACPQMVLPVRIANTDINGTRGDSGGTVIDDESHDGGHHDDGNHDGQQTNDVIGASAENGTASVSVASGTNVTTVSASHGQVSIAINGVSQTPPLHGH